MEIIDVVNENDETLGKKNKPDLIKDVDWYRVARIWVLNPEREVLIHKRSDKKETFPGCWDVTFGGQVRHKENYLDAAKRELKEELGLENVDLIETGNWKTHERKFLFHDFLFVYDGKAEGLEFQKEEISELKFVDLAEIEKIYGGEKPSKDFIYFGGISLKERIDVMKSKLP